LILFLRYTTSVLLARCWMVVSPRAAHSLRFPVVWYDIVVIGEVFVADGAYASLLDNLSIQKFPHLGR
jgi:hypothetical protein